jgi:hypothetical protein
MPRFPLIRLLAFSSLAWLTQAGGKLTDSACAIACGYAGSLVIGGACTAPSDFGNQHPAPTQGVDLYVARLNEIPPEDRKKSAAFADLSGLAGEAPHALPDARFLAVGNERTRQQFGDRRPARQLRVLDKLIDHLAATFRSDFPQQAVAFRICQRQETVPHEEKSEQVEQSFLHTSSFASLEETGPSVST